MQVHNPYSEMSLAQIHYKWISYPELRENIKDYIMREYNFPSSDIAFNLRYAVSDENRVVHVADPRVLPESKELLQILRQRLTMIDEDYAPNIAPPLFPWEEEWEEDMVARIRRMLLCWTINSGLYPYDDELRLLTISDRHQDELGFEVFPELIPWLAMSRSVPRANTVYHLVEMGMDEEIGQTVLTMSESGSVSYKLLLFLVAARSRDEDTIAQMFEEFAYLTRTMASEEMARQKLGIYLDFAYFFPSGTELQNPLTVEEDEQIAYNRLKEHMNGFMDEIERALIRAQDEGVFVEMNEYYAVRRRFLNSVRNVFGWEREDLL